MRAYVSKQEAVPLNNGWNEETITSTCQLSVCHKKSDPMAAGVDFAPGGGGGSGGGAKSSGGGGGWLGDLTHNKAIMVEVISRALFPLLFLIFNVIYWPMYLM